MRNIILTFIFILLPFWSLAGTPGFLKERMGTMDGQIILEDGSPLPGGIVAFFNEETGPPPMLMGGSRVPDAVFDVDGDGHFSAKLVPGSFYLGTLLVTEPGRKPGPPKPGEQFFFAADEKNGLRVFTVTIRQKQDVGKIVVFPPDKIIDNKVYMTLEGTVVDPESRPFPDAVVLVKKDPKAMRPDYVSEQVGTDGRFKIKMPEGTYYLMARQVRDNSIMGQPLPGSHVGTYGVDKAPTEGIPGRSGPAGGISPPAGVGLQRMTGPATGITPGAGVETEEAQPVSGKAGEIITGLTIKVFPIARPGELTADSYFKVTGTVQNAEGRPMTGMQVHAKENFSDFRAPFTSSATDSRGTFHLELPAGKNYYLLAKSTAMGPPQPGALVGFYGLQKPLKELLVFLQPDSPEYKEYFAQAKSVTGDADATVAGVLITVFPLGAEDRESTPDSLEKIE